MTKEIIWIVIGQAMAFVASLFIIKLLTNNLNANQYGVLSLALTIAVLINQVIMGGVIGAISRFYSISVVRQDIEKFLKKSIFLLILSALLAGVLTYFLADLFKDYHSFDKTLVFLVILYAIMNSTNNALNAVQNAARQRTVVAIHSGLNGWIKYSLVAAAFIFWSRVSINTVLATYIISIILVMVSQIYFLRKLVKIVTSKYDLRKEKRETNWYIDIIKFSWPFSTWGLFSWAQSVSDRWAIEWYGSTEEVGQFAVLYSLGYTTITMLTRLLTSLVGPILYEKSGEANIAVKNQLVHKSAWKLTYILLIITSGMFLMSFIFNKQIYLLFTSPEYYSTSKYLPWVILAGGIYAAAEILSLKFLSELKPTELIPIKIVTSITAVLLNILGAMHYGMPGVIYSLVIFSMVYLIWIMLQARSVIVTEK